MAIDHRARFYLLFLTAQGLASCDSQPTGVAAPADLFDMQAVTVETLDANSWQYRITAGQARGDYHQTRLSGALIDGRAPSGAASGVTALVPRAELELERMRGTLSGGLLLRLDGGLLVATPSAALDGQTLSTDARIDVLGPSLQAAVAGAEIDSGRQRLVSRGPVSGELRGAAPVARQP